MLRKDLLGALVLGAIALASLHEFGAHSGGDPESVRPFRVPRIEFFRAALAEEAQPDSQPAEPALDALLRQAASSRRGETAAASTGPPAKMDRLMGLFARGRADDRLRQERTQAAEVRRQLLEFQAATQVRRAERLFRQARYQECQSVLELVPAALAALGPSPESRVIRQDAARLLARAQEQLAKGALAPRTAVEAEGSGRTSLTRAQRTDRLVEGAEQLFDDGLYEQCIETCENALDLDPEHEDAEKLQNQALEHIARRREKKIHQRKAIQEEKIWNQLIEDSIPPRKILVCPKWREVETASKEQRREELLDPEQAKIEKKLSKRVSLEFAGTPLAEVCGYLSDLSGVNFVLDPKAVQEADDPRLPVKLNLADLELRSALKLVLFLTGLKSTYRNGAIFISDAKHIRGKPARKVYPVKDVLAHFVDAPSPLDPFALVEDGLSEPSRMYFSGRDREGVRAYLADDLGGLEKEGKNLAELIRDTIAQDTWRDELGGSGQNTIVYRNGQLIVTQTPDIHIQIQALLDRLREAQIRLVTVAARFITINNDELETLGLDFRGGGRAMLDDSGLGDATSGFSNPRGGRNDVRVRIAHALEGGLGQRLNPTEGLNLQYALLRDYQINAIMNAVVKRQRGNALTSPLVTCFDGQRANLSLVDNVSYISSVDSSGIPSISTFPDGIIFDVRPTVSPDAKFITLTLQPSINRLVELQSFTTPDDEGGETIAQTPRVTVSQVQTTVTVPNGGTILVGGLAKAREVEGFSSLPFIEKIPILNQIFGRRARSDEKDTLIVLVHARVVSPADR